MVAHRNEIKQSPLWSRAHIQKALGGTLHLGGLELTEHLVTRAGIKPHWRVLDVACGTGQSVVHLRRRHGVKAFGCDVLLSQIKKAQNQGFSMRFTPLLVADAHYIPFLCASMDMILCECALSLMKSPVLALRAMRRTLKAQGILAISDLYLQGEASEEISTSPLPQGSCLTWAARRADIEKLMEDAGFEILSFEDHSYLLKDLAAKLAFIGDDTVCQSTSGQSTSGQSTACSCTIQSPQANKVGYFSLLAISKT